MLSETSGNHNFMTQLSNTFETRNNLGFMTMISEDSLDQRQLFMTLLSNTFETRYDNDFRGFSRSKQAVYDSAFKDF